MDVGVEFGHYKVVEHIGRGGMADVWSARDKRLSRTVAIKTIQRDLSKDLDPVRLFEREAQTIAALEHPHILPIYEFGDYDNQLYIVMRYVSGGSLEDLVQTGALPVDQVVQLAHAVARALDYAHTNKVVHLDLKPSNILLDSNESPYLADFGLAAMMDPEGRAANPGSGTLLYMAPEQLTADVLDHRADIYSFSVMVYEMLTGQLPFDGSVPLALKQLQYQEDLPDITQIVPSLPVELTSILRRGAAMEVYARPDSIKALMDDIESVLLPARMTRVGGVVAGESEYEADLGDLITQPASGPDAMARREAVDIYQRARRAWAHGQGRFLLGITHFTLICDYYMAADRYNLALDEAGTQMFLRGALEYDHEIDYWWSKLTDESRRWVLLHTIRSESAPARVRAFQRLLTVPDTDPPQIPRFVAQALQVELNTEAQIAAIEVLAARAETGQARIEYQLAARGKQTESPGEAALEKLTVPQGVTALGAKEVRQTERRTNRLATAAYRLTTQLQLRTPEVWRDVVYAPEIDLLLADKALNSPSAAVAEKAARTIGQIYSLTAIQQIAEAQKRGKKGALRALALVRDEAPSLPPIVSQQARLYAWLANTWRRLTDNQLGIVQRFLLAFLGSFIAIGANTYITYRSEAIFSSARLGTSVAIGLTCGILIALLVLLANEFPARLRGFWPWWARLIVSGVIGVLWGILVWTAYTYLFLEYVPEWYPITLAGVGLSLGLIISGVFRLPAVISILLTAATTYYPLYKAFNDYLPPVIYYDYPEQIYVLTIPLALLIALGAHWGALRDMIGALLRRQPRAADSGELSPAR